MSHIEQMSFVSMVKGWYPEFFSGKKVLEVGSLNINGSVRQFFNDCEYIGCDLGEGDGVDIVSFGHELLFPNNHFDVSISCECFEHDKHWVETFDNMVRMTKGLVLFTCATTGRPEHGTTRSKPSDAPFTNDYYRNLTEEDFREEFEFDSMFKKHVFFINPLSHDLYFYGVK